MYCVVAVNPDGDRWVAYELRALLLRLELDCGGWYEFIHSTHEVTIGGSGAKEAIGWRVRWNDGVCEPYDIYITREEIIE